MARGISRSQESGLSGPAAASFRGGIEIDIVGNFAIGTTQFAGDHRTQIRQFERRFIAPPEVHQRCTAAMIADLGVERADDRGVLDPL